MSFEVPYNRPFIVGKELYYIAQAVTYGNLGGDGPYTQECGRLLESRFNIPNVLLTPSCTSALELAAMLCRFEPGDEVILPSFTFVSTANAVVRAGAVPVFVDIRPDTLNIDEKLVEGCVSPRTRAIFAVHYAGVGCEMDYLLNIAGSHGLMVVEDAAQGVNAFYRGEALGSIGDLGAYSFHETKNFMCGEGGALCVNNSDFLDRAHVLRDKGTNRPDLLAGLVRKYEWMEVGSSCIPSELVSAFLYGQLEEMDRISERRQRVYTYYSQNLEALESKGLLARPTVPSHCDTNHHIFHILLPTESQRDSLESHLARNGIQAISHYEPLHSSPMGRKIGAGILELPVTQQVSRRLLRLPMFFGITEAEQAMVIRKIYEHLESATRPFGVGLNATSTEKSTHDGH